jgi:arginine decarboxylase
MSTMTRARSIDRGRAITLVSVTRGDDTMPIPRRTALSDARIKCESRRTLRRRLKYVGSVIGFPTVFNLVPKEMFFTKGVGKHREKLTSFELALRSAGIAACNLVRVSSIFPPGCRIMSRSEGMKRLKPGQVTFVVMSEAATREPHRLIAATVGVAIPRDPKLYGYLSEHHSFGENEETAGDYAEELAAEMLATTLGLEFDPDKSWDEKKEVYRLSNQIVRTQNVTQTAVGDKNGLWTTVVAAAVLVG